MPLISEPFRSVSIFLSYSREDAALQDVLVKQLSPLRRQGIITQWYDCDISAGSEWKQITQTYLSTSDIIVLLISPDFIASEYCYSVDQRALAIREQTLGPEYPQTAFVLNNLAELYGAQNRHAEAEPLYQRALAIREQTLGPEHPQVAQSLNGLAHLYGVQGKQAEAKSLYQRALAIYKRTLGLDHPDAAIITKNYMSLLQRMQKEE